MILFFLELVFLLAVAVLFFVSVLNAWSLPRVRRASAPFDRALSICIPARNEEHNIGACLQAALSQGRVLREVIVCDDHSTDRTRSIVEGWVKRDGRVRLIASEKLPPGWLGKTWACHQLSEAAAAEWLLFLDADARLTGPDSAGRILCEAVERNATFLSPWPGLDCETFWERALMPMLNFCVFSIYPAWQAAKSRSARFGLGHGACLLMQRKAYDRVGGHEAVKGEFFEDTSLARLWRVHGEHSLAVDGQDAVRVRMYTGFEEIWAGATRIFFPAFRSTVMFWLFMALHGFLFLLPFVLAPIVWLAGGPSWPLWAACGYILLARAVLAIRFRFSWWTPLLHPVSEALFLAVGLSSWRRCVSGKGIAWKGRNYGGAGQPPGMRK